MIVRELDVDLDAFEGPFDLLLTLVLKEEARPGRGGRGGHRRRFLRTARRTRRARSRGVRRVPRARRGAAGAEGARALPYEDAKFSRFQPEEAAEELARRLAEYRRAKEAAAWLAERLEAEGDRFFRLGPAPLAPRVERRLAPQEPESLAVALRLLAAEPPSVSLAHLELRFPPVSQFLDRFRAVLRRRRRFDLDAEVDGLSRIEQAVAFLALLELRRSGEVSLEQAAPFAPIRVQRAEAVEERSQEWIARSA